MTTTFARLCVLGTLAVAACTGGWENDPLLPGFGGVEGSFAGPVDASSAWVAVLGQPEFVASVDAEGRFLLPRVASGRIELAGSDGRGGSVREGLTVYAERVVALTVATAPEGLIEGIATLEDAERPLSVSLSVGGLPVTATSDDEGRFRIAGLPPGCFTVTAAREGWIAARREACVVAGKSTWAPFHLRSASVGPPARALCEPCETDDECEDDSCAALAPGGPRVCTKGCETDVDCPQGTVCIPGLSVCGPRAVGCATYRDTTGEKACDEDDDCGAGEDDDARCVEGLCTWTCSEDDECPEGLACVGDAESALSCR